jgi:hypothetical protein
MSQLFHHELSDKAFVFAHAVLKPIQEVEEEFADVLLLVYGDRDSIVVDQALEHCCGILILLIREKHAGKHLLQIINKQFTLLDLSLFHRVYLTVLFGYFQVFEVSKLILLVVREDLFLNIRDVKQCLHQTCKITRVTDVFEA